MGLLLRASLDGALHQAFAYDSNGNRTSRTTDATRVVPLPEPAPDRSSLAEEPTDHLGAPRLRVGCHLAEGCRKGTHP